MYTPPPPPPPGIVTTLLITSTYKSEPLPKNLSRLSANIASSSRSDDVTHSELSVRPHQITDRDGQAVHTHEVCVALLRSGTRTGISQGGKNIRAALMKLNSQQ